MPLKHGEKALLSHDYKMKHLLEASPLELCSQWRALWGASGGFQEGSCSIVAQVINSLPADVGDAGSIPGSGRSPGEGNGSPLQYSCLENPMDGGAW